jgi:hypothetical protein
MPGGTMVVGVTLALAAVSATVFLVLRCRGVGRPFGPGSRWSAVAVVGLTSLVSTGVAVASTTVLQHVPPVLVGAAAPSGLWLGHIRQRADGRRGLGHEVSTLWLAWLLDRLHQGMADDRVKWCETRVDPRWDLHELSSAANFYYEYLKERLSPEEHRRERIHARLQGIERRLDVAQLIEDDATRSKVVTALRSSRVTKEPRYERYLNDLPRLGGILRHDAERDLVRLLGSAYRTGCYRLQAYSPSVRNPAPAYPPGRPLPPHP